MRNLKNSLVLLVLLITIISCAESKDFVIDGKKVTIEPYGWFDTEAKHDSIIYKVNTGNVVWSIVGVETIIIPIVLTGNSLYEPVRKK